MFKSTVFLVLLGLAAGLWLGFNPQAHQKTIQEWQGVKSGYMKFAADTNVKVQGVNNHLTTTSQTNAKPGINIQPEASAAWKQVTTAFEEMWNSVQRFFANTTAKINSSR